MHSLLDRSTILAGLVDEVRPLLPQLGGALGDLCAGFGRAEAAEQALETAFMIRAAAEMLELDTLAECGRLVEAVVPVLASSPPELLKEGLPVVQILLGALTQATEGLVSRSDVPPQLMQSARQGVERLLAKQAALPKEEPAAPLDLEALLATLPVAPPTAEIAASDLAESAAPEMTEPTVPATAELTVPARVEPAVPEMAEPTAPDLAEPTAVTFEALVPELPAASDDLGLTDREPWLPAGDELADRPIEPRPEDGPATEPDDHLTRSNGWSREELDQPEQVTAEEPMAALPVEPELLGRAEWLPEPLPSTNGVHGPGEAPASEVAAAADQPELKADLGPPDTGEDWTEAPAAADQPELRADLEPPVTGPDWTAAPAAADQPAPKADLEPLAAAEDWAEGQASGLELPDDRPEVVPSPVEQLWNAWSEPLGEPTAETNAAPSSDLASDDARVEIGLLEGSADPTRAKGAIDPSASQSEAPPARPPARPGLFSRFLSSLNGRRGQPSTQPEPEPSASTPQPTAAPLEAAGLEPTSPLDEPAQPTTQDLLEEPSPAKPATEAPQAWPVLEQQEPVAASWEPAAVAWEPADGPDQPAELRTEPLTEAEPQAQAIGGSESPVEATTEFEPGDELVVTVEPAVDASAETEPTEAPSLTQGPEPSWSWSVDLPEASATELQATAEPAPEADHSWWTEPTNGSAWADAPAAAEVPSTEMTEVEKTEAAAPPDAAEEPGPTWSLETAEPFGSNVAAELPALVESPEAVESIEPVASEWPQAVAPVEPVAVDEWPEPAESAAVDESVKPAESAAVDESVEPIAVVAARPRPELPPLPPQQEVDPEILEVFKEEADEVLAEIGRQLAAVQVDPSDKRAAAELRRACHTLKGAANVVGFPTIGLACKTMEDLLDGLAEAGQSPSPAALRFLTSSHGTVRQLSETPTDDELLGQVAELYAEGTALTLGIEVSPAEPAEPETSGEEAAWARAVDAFLADEAVAPDQPAEPAPSATTEGEPDALAEAVPPRFDLPTVGASAADELSLTFAQEAEEHLATLSGAALRLDLDPSDGSALAEARRVLHTLKGAAGALGLLAISGFCHDTETSLEQQPASDRARLLFEAAETLEVSVAHLAATGQESIRELAAAADLPEATLLPPPVELAPTPTESAPAGPRPIEPPAQFEPPMAIEPTPIAARAAEASEPVGAVLAEEAAASSAVRVELGRVDDLLNLVGEIVLSRTGLEQRLERVSRSADELRLTVARLRKVAQYLEDRYEVAELVRTSPDEPRYGEFDELEMDRYTELHRVSREMTELAADAETTSDEVEQVLKELDALAMRQARLGSDLQDKLMAVRLVPLSSLQARLHRTARSVALRQGKEVEFQLRGGETELDKRVIEQLGDILLHLVRNAVDHGIESPERRAAAGKSARGSLSLRAFREGSEAVVQLSDDGAGIDLVRLRQRAELLGLVGKEQELDQQELLELIFQPGVSTSTTTTEVSGRGVGLDVVRTAIRRLKGAIEVSSEPGLGTTFTLRLPVVLAVLQAMLVRGGDQVYAVPMSALERVVRSARRPVVSLGRAAVVELEGETFPFQDLALTLGRPANRRPGSEMPLLVVRTGDRRVALAVDDLLGQQEVVVKALGTHLRAIRGVLGAALQGNGQVLLVLNTAELLTARLLLESSRASGPSAAAPVVNDGPLSALVVDDSLSVRKVLARALERDGWQVRQARDGVDALEVLQEYRPHVVLMDIEMPRMDGFELTGILRDVPDYGHPPVVMITSRGGEKHRKRADELGVAGYVVKPYQETDLLATLRQVAVVNGGGSR